MKDIQPGVYQDLSNEDYHRSNGISKTKLDMFANDESSLEWLEKCPVDSEKLKTLGFGSACHTMLLEPEKMATEYVVMPKFNGRSDAGKEEKRLWLDEYKDSTIITTDEEKKLKLMRESVMAHPYARKLLEAGGISEQSHYAIDEDSGVLLKCRPDRSVYNSPILIDVKTTDTIDKFKFSIEDYRYYIADPFYLDVYNASTSEEKDTFVFLVIQKTIELGRYPVRCITLPRAAIDYGRRQYKAELMRYAEAKALGNFKGIYEADLGYYFNKKIDQ